MQVQVPASTCVEVDDRLVPTRRLGVEGSAVDLRQRRRLGDTRLDTAFTDLIRDDDGMWHCEVVTEAVGRIVLWADAAFPWVQVFTGAVEKGWANRGSPWSR